ncbi:hypothetical protein LSM04_009316 [Trypanosoma melophagium]|uniref:uncharacterized protein n=1 Tax=Trypanosoma melophagium TaxID=715481 RepID=UPI00351A1B85|nr:hypothetical protein LSM04_009316 [Trypanosoma melophagium]
MEQEALEEQRHRKQQQEDQQEQVNSETSRRIENNSWRSSLSVELQNYATCWKNLQKTAVDKSYIGASEIECFCVELNKNLDLMEKEATVQSYLMDLCNHYYSEELKLHDEITEVTKLLQDDVLVLLEDVCSLLSDSERDDISASLEVKS